MHTRAQHCPFLNRCDSRCAEHLRLHDLGYAFAYCFGHYARCQVYFEILMRRKLKVSEARVRLTVRARAIGPAT